MKVKVFLWNHYIHNDFLSECQDQVYLYIFCMSGASSCSNRTLCKGSTFETFDCKSSNMVVAWIAFAIARSHVIRILLVEICKTERVRLLPQRWEDSRHQITYDCFCVWLCSIMLINSLFWRVLHSLNVLPGYVYINELPHIRLNGRKDKSASPIFLCFSK